MAEIISHVLGELSNYLNGSLTRNDRQRVEDHLQGCDDCRRHCEELSRMRKMVYPPPIYWRDRIPMKTLIFLAVAGVLYMGAGKLRRTLDLPKSTATLVQATSPVVPDAKPALPKEEPVSAAVTAPPAPVAEAPKPVPRQLPEWQGQYSGIADLRAITIQNKEEWALLWQEHHLSNANPPAVPILDFDQIMVVGVYTGRQPAGSPGVKIFEIQSLPDQILVRYGDTPALPNSDPGLPQIQPYHLRAIPKTALPIRFERQPATPPAP